MDRFIAILALGAALGVAAIILFASSPTHHAHLWAALLAAGAILCVLAAIAESLLTRPRLVLGAPFTADRSIRKPTIPTAGEYHGGTVSASFALSATSVSFGLYATFAYVPVTNQPLVGSKDAENVSGHLWFFDSDYEPLHEISGRWSATPQHPYSELTLRAAEITIPKTTSDHAAHPLDVAMKYPNERECFAFNEENRFSSPDDLKHHPLGEPPIHLRVEVVGSNTRRVKREYVLIDRDGRLEIEPWA